MALSGENIYGEGYLYRSICAVYQLSLKLTNDRADRRIVTSGFN